jgi:hypothetical protein
MYIAYSALKKSKQQTPHNNQTEDEQLKLRYKAYQAVCTKYSNEIADIQKYFPGWIPSFNNTK